jgi:hypothetical protein
MSSPTETFGIPDRWCRYLKIKAKFFYEDRRNYGNPEETQMEAERELIGILAESETMNGSYVLPERLF